MTLLVLSNVFVLLVALLHFYFMILEAYYWTKPKGLKIFGMTKAQAEASKTLAQNQGLYNGFLAAGLVWGVLEPDDLAWKVKIFFLSCVILAGIVGAWTVNKRIFFVQSVPAIIAAVLVCLSVA